MKCKLKPCKNKANAYFRSLPVCNDCYKKLRWDEDLMKQLVRVVDGTKS